MVVLEVEVSEGGAGREPVNVRDKVVVEIEHSEITAGPQALLEGGEGGGDGVTITS